MSHVSKIREKHPNSKFCKGSRAYAARQLVLKEIQNCMIAGRNFTFLQGQSAPQGSTSD